MAWHWEVWSSHAIGSPWLGEHAFIPPLLLRLALHRWRGPVLEFEAVNDLAGTVALAKPVRAALFKRREQAANKVRD